MTRQSYSFSSSFWRTSSPVATAVTSTSPPSLSSFTRLSRWVSSSSTSSRRRSLRSRKLASWLKTRSRPSLLTGLVR